ncbi:MAG: TonB family protein [Candidatus Omnitrophica bacterium]|nr:TonB family protein [Candidatus Omnitrophota bacterium]MCM8777173.1 TonB family protein [Candidatus Omnitrophota bacterium]
MLWKNHLLPKAFIISLLIHITGISVFSLILPVSRREIRPLEVSLLPVSTAPEKSFSEVRSISPEIPKSSPRKEKITIETRKEILRFSPDEIAGLSRAITPPEILSTRFELPEVKIPEITPFNLAGTASEKKSAFSDVEIEGPAGERVLIYREPVEYPGWAIEKAMEGNIRIKFWVAPDGKIVLTNLITSSGYPELDLYTEQRFRKWVFESVRTDKQAWGLITFRFYLK